MVAKIMVAEDNTSVYSCYQNFLSKDKTIEFIGNASDGDSAVEMYKKNNPDILLLDLKLPKKNGLEILNELTKYESKNIKCNVIVISGDAELRNKLFNTRKVYRVIPKPAQLDLLKETIDDYKKELLVDAFSEIKCNTLLMKLKINPYSRNGRLMAEAIELCYCDINLLDTINKTYHILGHRHSCSPEKIKSGLRSIVKTANRFSDPIILNSMFYIDSDKALSTKNFINGIILKLKEY